MTKSFYPAYIAKKTKELRKLSRSDARRLIEIVTGQNNMHCVQNKINYSQDLCRLCEEEEETFDNLVILILPLPNTTPDAMLRPEQDYQL